MKAWLLDELNGIDRLRLSDIAAPVPQENEVLLQLRYAALNPADRYLAEGQYPAKPPLPHILGRDGIGTVAAVGLKADPSLVGQRRAILRGPVGVDRAGTFAELVAVP